MKRKEQKSKKSAKYKLTKLQHNTDKEYILWKLMKNGSRSEEGLEEDKIRREL